MAASSTAFGNHDRKFIGPDPCWIFFEVSTENGDNAATDDVLLRKLGSDVKVFDVTWYNSSPEVGSTSPTCDIHFGTLSTVTGGPIFTGTTGNLANLQRDPLVPIQGTTTSSTYLWARVTRSGTAASAGAGTVGLLVARETY